MSFGFSVGDFLAAAGLIKDITLSLRNASASSYQELALELHGLQRALHEIEHLQCPPSQQGAINSVKVAALMCQHPLDEFAGKLRKYEALEVRHGSSLSTAERLKLWRRKLQWGFSMEEEVVKLRAYIAAHVGSLNMRLITLGISSSSLAVKKHDEDSSDLQSKVDNTHNEVTQIGRVINKYGMLTTNNNTLLQRLSSMMSGRLTIQLNSLIDMMNKIWNVNFQIMTVVTSLQNSPPQPNASYTWFQEPVRFEDALGRIIPIPSEYSWSKIHAIILDQFSKGPGSDKVKAGDYLLFNSFDVTQDLTADSQGLIPGMSITMSLVVGHYGEGSLAVCPRIGCNSKQIEEHSAGGKRCTACKSWFDRSRKQLPLPLRPETFEQESASKGNPRLPRSRRMIPVQHTRRECSDTLLMWRNERRYFKNISIHFMELPRTPTVSNVRAKASKRKIIELGEAKQESRKRQKGQPEGSSITGIDVKHRRPRGKEVQKITNEVSAGIIRNGTQDIEEIDPLVTWILGLESPISDIDHTFQQVIIGAMAERFNSAKCPSVISEPRWIAHSSAASTIGHQSAPFEYFGSSQAVMKSTIELPSVLSEDFSSPRAIRKYHACLRCKFLKKTCDKGDPCAGCQPSITRLWEVPCTRISVGDLGYFMEDWHANYEKPIVPEDNVPGYYSWTGRPAEERIMYVSHGYGLSIPIMVCSDYHNDVTQFHAKWKESVAGGEPPIEFEVETDRLKLYDSLSPQALGDYLDKHLDGPFGDLINFSSITFIPGVLKTIHKYYTMQPKKQIRDALKLVLCYGLAKRITIVEHGTTGSFYTGQVLHSQSAYYGKTIVPPSINAEISQALAEEWQDLQIGIFECLSTLYTGVYSGNRLQNWFEIFVLSSILLIVWEEMLFDYAHRVEDETTVNEFWSKVKTVPVNVIVGLFAAISQKLPRFSAWDTRKHGQLLNNDVAVCEAMTELRSHVINHEIYLKSRKDTPYDRSNFGSVSNVFLSRLFLRKNGGVFGV